MSQWLYLVVGDCKCGNHRFLAPVKDKLCGAMARLCRDRVLYGRPGPYSGKGRPQVHGDRFAWSVIGCPIPFGWTAGRHLTKRREIKSWSTYVIGMIGTSI